jgi:hypothetical protein
VNGAVSPDVIFPSVDVHTATGAPGYAGIVMGGTATSPGAVVDAPGTGNRCLFYAISIASIGKHPEPQVTRLRAGVLRALEVALGEFILGDLNVAHRSDKDKEGMQRCLVGQATLGSTYQEIVREIRIVKNNLGAGLLSLHLAATFVMTDWLRVVAHACAQGSTQPHIIYDSMPHALPSMKTIHLLYSGPLNDAITGIAVDVPLSHWQVMTRLLAEDMATATSYSVDPALPRSAMGIASDKQIEASIKSRAAVAKQQYRDIRQALGGTWQATHHFITHIDSGPGKAVSDPCYHGPGEKIRLALAHSRISCVMVPSAPAPLGAAAAVAPSPPEAVANPSGVARPSSTATLPSLAEAAPTSAEEPPVSAAAAPATAVAAAAPASGVAAPATSAPALSVAALPPPRPRTSTGCAGGIRRSGPCPGLASTRPPAA